VSGIPFRAAAMETAIVELIEELTAEQKAEDDEEGSDR
jgi:hypothetical protein